MNQVVLDALVLTRGSHKQRNQGVCVIWPGRKDENGYGWASGNRRAHRVVWEEAHGPIPSGLVVMHVCDNPPCVNLDHLQLGSVGDNNRDRHNKGRSKSLFESGPNHPATRRSGERHWQAKLSDNDVAALRRRHAAGETQTSLAIEYEVNSATVSRIVRGLWRAS